MKYIRKYYLYILAFVVLACSDDDKTIDILLPSVERGAVLRTVSVSTGALDVLNTSGTVSIEVEEQDDENGDLLSEVRVFVNLTDNTPDAMTATNESLVTTVSRADFETGPFGLPRGAFSLTVGEMASALGISFGDYNCGDTFVLRLELELTDGRVFSSDSLTGTVQGGSFFTSPYQYAVNLVAPLPSDDLYTGQYQLTTLSIGNLGVGDYVDGIYEIESINNTTKVVRNVPTLGGGFGPVDFEFQFICGEIVMTPGQSLGAGCNAAIASGPAIINTTYNLNDPEDSDFIINFTSDETDDCGVGSSQVSIQLSKV